MSYRDNYQIFINSEKGTVAVKLQERQFREAVYDTALGKLNREFKNSKLCVEAYGINMFYEYIEIFFQKWYEARNYKKSIVTRAKCNFKDGDQFSNMIGVYIASNRMDAKIAETAFVFLCDFYEELRRYTTEMLRQAEKIGIFALKTIDHIEELGSLQD